MEIIGQPGEEQNKQSPLPAYDSPIIMGRQRASSPRVAPKAADTTGVAPRGPLPFPYIGDGDRDGAGGVPSRPVPSRSVDASADLERARVKPRWLAICFAVTFLAYVALIPHFLRYDSPPTGDQPFYLMITSSILQDGDLELTNNYNNKEYDKFYGLAPHPDNFVGMLAPYPLTMHLAFSKARPGERYGFHLPGLPLLLVPAWVVGGWFSLWWPMTIVFMCLVGALVAVNVFLLAHELTGRLWIAVVVWLTVAFSNPVMSYSFLIFTELATGLLLIYAFRRLALGWGSNGPLRLLLVGICIGYIPWLAWRCVPIAAGLSLYAAIQWWRYRKQTMDDGRWTMGMSEAGAIGRVLSIVHRPSSIVSYLWLLLPVAISAALLADYNFFLFGNLTPPPKINELGDLYPFHWPWAGMQELTAFFTSAFGLLFDENFGLLVYTPVYLLAIVGIIAMIRSSRRADGRLLLAMALVSLPYLGTIASYDFWHGAWCPPARFLTTFVPLLGGLLAMSLLALDNWLYKLIYGVMALAGFAAMGAMMWDPRNMWPWDPANTYLWLQNASPVPLNIGSLMDNYQAPNDILHPLTTAQTIGLAVLIVSFCYLLMLVWGGRWSAHKLSLPVHGLVWLGCVAAIGLGWGVMNYPFLKSRTVLTQLHRWEISTPLAQPYGIAYYDGKIYIASYGQRLPTGDFQLGQLGAFNPANGQYAIMSPRPVKGFATILHPSEVKVGPDGLLYLLNNGEGNQAMFALNSKMEVVRQLALGNKSTISIGLSFGPDGKIYVADMVGGHVLRYEPTGGDPLNSWSGLDSRYNNIEGVTVAPDGMIYTFEGSYQRIQQFDPTGRFIRLYNVGCHAIYGAIDGDWMDVTCQNGFRSINLKDHSIQLPTYASNSPKPEEVPKLSSPTGLAYGPDHTLYVLDGQMLYHYKVQH